jgi:RimJ/RimL family protein N-acetyltransferase
MRPEVSSARLVLRRYEQRFAPLLWEAVQAARSPAFTRYATWCHAAYGVADSHAFVEQCVTNWANGTAFEFAIFDAQTAAFCGGIGLNQPNVRHGFYNLGYWVSPAHQRQGLASLAVQQLAQAAFADLPALNRIEILTAPDNEASQRTALSAGATREGVLRQRLREHDGAVLDAVLFSLVRSR